VNPVGAEPYFERLPSAEVAAAVPVPDVVPPADSTVRLMESSTVPVTVRVPEEVLASAAPWRVASAIQVDNAKKLVMRCAGLFILLAD
jgi:hypothetical protein